MEYFKFGYSVILSYENRLRYSIFLYLCRWNTNDKLMMKKLSCWIASLLTLCGISFSSCGEDRSVEYYALIQPKIWIYEVMQQYYLFYEDLPDEEGLNFFNKPQEFLKSVVSSKDKKNGVTFSHVDSVFTATRAVSESPSFGIEGAMVQAPSGAYAIRVLYTQPDSPAEEAGIQRGDWIISVDNKKMKSTDYSTYISNPTQAYTFTLGNYNGEDFDTIPQKIQMPAPRYIEIHNLLTKQILDIGGKKVAYLLYNEFGDSDAEELDQWFTEVASVNPEAIILDLRYNPGGYLNIAQKLGSMLAPQTAQGQPFVRMTYNDKINQEEVLSIESSLIPNGLTLNYNNLYIVTTSNTASASEVIINCLKPYLNEHLIQVGTATFGKNIGQQLFTDEKAPQLELWLSTIYLSNSEGFKDYFDNGLTPDFEQSEDMSGTLGDFATETDELIQPVFTHIETGSFQTNPEEEGEENETQMNSRGNSGKDIRIIYNSIASKPRCAKK